MIPSENPSIHEISDVTSTVCKDLTFHGKFKFSCCDTENRFRRFIRFQISKNELDQKETLSIMVEHAFQFVDLNSELLIAVTGGFKRMKLSHNQKINFKQGLIEIMKENRKNVVELLFEGGIRAFNEVHELVKNDIRIVIFNHSGRASNLISEVFNPKDKSLKININEAVLKYQESLWLKQPLEIRKIERQLTEMFQNYKSRIFIYDMNRNDLKFAKTIAEAFISGLKIEEKILELLIRCDCLEIANKYLGSHYYDKYLEIIFETALKADNANLVPLFLDYGLEIEGIIKEDFVERLYESLKKSNRSYHYLFDETKGPKDDIFYITGKIISRLSGDILPEYYMKKKDREARDSRKYGIQDLFLWALLGGRVKIALVFWKIGEDHVGSALIASIILNQIAEKEKKLGDSDRYHELKEASEEFQNMAYKVLSEAYRESSGKVNKILTRKLNNWNELTCLDIAVYGKLITFLSHKSCYSYLRELWRGELSPFLPRIKIIPCIPFRSLYCLYSMCKRKDGKKSEEMEMRARSSSETRDSELLMSDQNRSESSSKSFPYGRTIISFYKTPVVIFYFYFISYIIFLSAFAYVNLSELIPRTDIGHIGDLKVEVFVYIYFLGFIAEEIRQFQKKDSTFQQKYQAYWSGSCNRFDYCFINIFVIAIFFRFAIPKDYFILCRSVYCIIFGLFCIRAMHFYFACEMFGPKVIMLKKMMRDLLFFLNIFAISTFSYGIMAQSMRFPNSSFNMSLFHDIIQRPYFQSYGDLMLDKMFDESRCNTFECSVKYTTVCIGFALYLLVTSLLFVNLLIAMFGYTFNKVQEDSNKYASFLRVKLVMEFKDKTCLPPPLNLLVITGLFFRKCICCANTNNEKKKDKPNIRVFEKVCMEKSMYVSQFNYNDQGMKTINEE